jgi:glyoxylase-like metal-dependent hydrolase (beta-lactamase superfamily II)/rhodanese-related sulfurtransferase
MILKPYFLGCLAHASYLVADETSKVAAIVDPQRDTDQYLEDAKKLGVEIRHVLLTHFHADFVAGHLELRDRAKAEIVLGKRANPSYPTKKIGDGESLALGPEVKITALETPGHTPESTCFVVFDLKKNPKEPQAVLTGDTLFIGDVGRPDLMVAKGKSSQELAKDMYRSLREKLMTLPDSTIVYPAHGAGSACGKNMSSEKSSTIGLQKKVNWALQPQSEAEFVSALTSDQPEAPRYFGFDADLNQKTRPTLEKVLEKALAPLSLDAFVAKAKAGAQILDARDADEFAKGYLAGAINVGLGGKYASWVGQVLSATKPIVIVAAPGKEKEAAVRLGRIGFDAVEGYLDGGMKAAEARPELVRRFERVAAKGLDESLHSKSPPLVLDIRTDGEWHAGHIDGALHIPLPHLEERMAEIPRGRPIVVQCGSGYRSTIGLSLLERAGVSGLTDLQGGMGAWEKAKLKTVT